MSDSPEVFWCDKAAEVAALMSARGVVRFAIYKSRLGYKFEVTPTPKKRARVECHVCKKSCAVSKHGHLHSHRSAGGKWCEVFGSLDTGR